MRLARRFPRRELTRLKTAYTEPEHEARRGRHPDGRRDVYINIRTMTAVSINIIGSGQLVGCWKMLEDVGWIEDSHDAHNGEILASGR